jgi:hypothetical protein
MHRLDASDSTLIISEMEDTTQNGPVEPATSKASLNRASSRFVLASGDIPILQMVFEHRFLDRNQLSRLLDRHEKRLHRRLFSLERAGYLTTIRLPQQSYLYGLGRLGINTMVERGIASGDRDERIRSHELKELFLNHEKMIVDVHVALSIASGASPARLTAWREGRGLYDSVVAVDGKGSDRLPIRPDAFFTLEDSRRPEGANRAHFALEADRSTTSHTRFEEKFRAYWNYVEQGLHVKKFGVKGFRILTVTLTDDRAKNLCTLAVKTLPDRARKYFLFGSLKNFSEDNINPISTAFCYSPRSSGFEDRHALLPTVQTLAQKS